MYALHPFTVHFPIALLLASTLFTLIALRRAGGWEQSGYHCLIVGWLAGVVALLTGLPGQGLDRRGGLADDSSPRLFSLASAASGSDADRALIPL